MPGNCGGSNGPLPTHNITFGCTDAVRDVIAWNTVYMAAVVDRLKAKGEKIAPEDLAHLSPARYDHINPYGHYQFRVDRWAGEKPLRPIKV